MREGDALKTICGTYLYLGPEVYKANAIPLERRPNYTALVDIWSLGVVLLELLVGLPKHGDMKSMRVEWCRRVRQRAESVFRRARDELLESFWHGCGDMSVGSSTLSRYIISNAERDVGSCNTPSPGPPRVHAGELLSRLWGGFERR